MSCTQRKKLIINNIIYNTHTRSRTNVHKRNTTHAKIHARTDDRRPEKNLLPSASTCSMRASHQRLENQRDSRILRSPQFHYYTILHYYHHHNYNHHFLRTHYDCRRRLCGTYYTYIIYIIWLRDDIFFIHNIHAG